jgi:PTS system mannose-specific IIB component/fructoselysine and glucoselysine-specific PTS system IIB component
MTGIVLYRVDERLIHGQVVIGWGSQLNPRRYLVVDDALAASEWEQELYRLSLPENVSAEFVSRALARELLPGWKEEELRSVLLTRDIETMLWLAEAGLLEGESVNVGGIHHAPGRTQVRSYVYLDEDDRRRLQRLEELGVTVIARDLPDSARVSLATLLKE